MGGSKYYINVNRGGTVNIYTGNNEENEKHQALCSPSNGNAGLQYANDKFDFEDAEEIKIEELPVKKLIGANPTKTSKHIHVAENDKKNTGSAKYMAFIIAGQLLCTYIMPTVEDRRAFLDMTMVGVGQMLGFFFPDYIRDKWFPGKNINYGVRAASEITGATIAAALVCSGNMNKAATIGIVGAAAGVAAGMALIKGYKEIMNNVHERHDAPAREDETSLRLRDRIGIIAQTYRTKKELCRIRD